MISGVLLEETIVGAALGGVGGSEGGEVGTAGGGVDAGALGAIVLGTGVGAGALGGSLGAAAGALGAGRAMGVTAGWVDAGALGQTKPADQVELLPTCEEVATVDVADVGRRAIGDSENAMVVDGCPVTFAAHSVWLRKG